MALMEEQTVLVEREKDLALVTVNRPQYLNALNIDVLTGLLAAFEKFRADAALRAVIITGAGEKAFVAGADIATMSGLGPRPIADYIQFGQRVMREVEACPVPVIAAVNGFALGGGLELALACDLIVAAKSARVGQPEVNLGIIPGFGGTQRLLRRTSVGFARRLVLTGEMVGAEEAYSQGLVDYLCEYSEIKDKALAVARTIGTKGPLAVRAAKEALRSADEQNLLAGLQSEVDLFLRTFQSADREEGMQAFLQKREAKFRGV